MFNHMVFKVNQMVQSQQWAQPPLFYWCFCYFAKNALHTRASAEQSVPAKNCTAATNISV